MAIWSQYNDVKMGGYGVVVGWIPENEGHALSLCDTLILVHLWSIWSIRLDINLTTQEKDRTS